MKFSRLALALAAPLLLASCFLTPGKFVSTLDIRKDRTFTFTYAGEVILLDPQQEMQSGIVKAPEGAEDGEGQTDEAAPAPPPATPAVETAEKLAERRAVADALSKEVGYRSVEYLGNNRFRVDYSMTGNLDRNFIYPINIDAMAIAPWIAVEVRKDGTARVKALAFGDPDTAFPGDLGGNKDKPQREGTFTLTTDATLVMQNNEDGMAPGPVTKVIWKVTPATKTVPTAVVRF